MRRHGHWSTSNCVGRVRVRQYKRQSFQTQRKGLLTHNAAKTAIEGALSDLYSTLDWTSSWNLRWLEFTRNTIPRRLRRWRPPLTSMRAVGLPCCRFEERVLCFGLCLSPSSNSSISADNIKQQFGAKCTYGHGIMSTCTCSTSWTVEAGYRAQGDGLDTSLNKYCKNIHGCPRDACHGAQETLNHRRS